MGERDQRRAVGPPDVDGEAFTRAVRRRESPRPIFERRTRASFGRRPTSSRRCALVSMLSARSMRCPRRTVDSCCATSTRREPPRRESGGSARRSITCWGKRRPGRRAAPRVRSGPARAVATSSSIAISTTRASATTSMRCSAGSPSESDSCTTGFTRWFSGVARRRCCRTATRSGTWYACDSPVRHQRRSGSMWDSGSRGGSRARAFGGSKRSTGMRTCT